MTDQKRVCVGAFAGAHGVKGDFKLKTFTENPKDIAAYGPVESEDGERTFTLQIAKVLGANFVLARAPEIKSREEATSLSSSPLFVDREQLPATQDNEFYLEDLVGLNVVDLSGAKCGVVVGIHNFGAGDIAELKNVPGRKGTILVAFTEANFPQIDLDARQITANETTLIEEVTPDDQERRG